jgi:hypothetical protein
VENVDEDVGGDDDGAVEDGEVVGGEGLRACLVSKAMRTRMSSNGYVHATDMVPIKGR